MNNTLVSNNPPPPFPCSSSCVICISVRPCTGSPFGSNSASHRTMYNTNCSVKGSACCRWSPQYMQSGSRNSGISCCTRWYCAMILGEGRLHHLLLLLYLKYKMSGYISVYIYSWVGYTLHCPSDTIFEHLSKLHFERSKLIFDKSLICDHYICWVYVLLKVCDLERTLTKNQSLGFCTNTRKTLLLSEIRAQRVYLTEWWRFANVCTPSECDF